MLWRSPYIGLSLSLVLHLLFWALVLFFPQPEQKENISIDIFVPEVQHTQKQIVIRDQKLPENLKKEHSIDPWRFLSEKTQSVQEQTRALQSGLTKNRSKISVNKIKIPSAKEFQNEIDPGISTFGNDLPIDVKIGQITALNTDRYLFYSYFARAEELLRHEWEPMVIQTIERPPIELAGSIHNKFTSIVEIWFYPNGKYHSSHLLKSSGVKALDYAATESFRLVQMIPNPPKERIEKDGLVRFEWSLTVLYNPKVLAKEQKE